MPPDCHLPEAPALGKMHFVFVGDKAFPLLSNLMQAYPGKFTTEEQQLFNYHLSHARLIVNNATSVLAARFRIFNTRINVEPNTTKLIVNADCVLHNILQSSNMPAKQVSLLDVAQNVNTEGLQTLWHFG